MYSKSYKYNRKAKIIQKYFRKNFIRRHLTNDDSKSGFFYPVFEIKKSFTNLLLSVVLLKKKGPGGVKNFIKVQELEAENPDSMFFFLGEVDQE